MPNKKYLLINEKTEKVFQDLFFLLSKIKKESTSEEIQTEIYEIGKNNNFENLREYFKLIYQVLLGQEEGPRLGSFIKLYGINKTCKLLEKVLKKEKISD